MKRQEIRAEFPLFKKKHYLNFGSSGPMPLKSVNKMYRHLSHQVDEGPSSPDFMKEYLTEYDDLKNSLAEFLNASPDEICITQNTTEGMNIVLRGLRWKRGDEIVTSELEHAGLEVPLNLLREDRGVKIKAVKVAPFGDEDILDEIDEAITLRTRLIALSHVDYVTGRRMPIKKISRLARRRSIPVLVDGAQAAGAITVDLKDLGCDFYSFPSHKWLLGPRGMGCLYIKKRRIKDIMPTFVGWCSVNNISPEVIVSLHAKRKDEKRGHNFADGAARYAVSTWSTAGVAGFLESLSIFKSDLKGDLEERLNDIANFKEELQKIEGVIILTPAPKEESAGIVSFKHMSKSSSWIAKRLIDAGAIIRYVPEMDCVRCCLSVINDKEDMDFFISSLKRIIAE